MEEILQQNLKSNFFEYENHSLNSGNKNQQWFIINKGGYGRFMSATEKAFLKDFITAFLSESEKDIVSNLYRLTEPFGNFSRRFIFEEEGKHYLLHKDGARELISEEQLKNLVELSDAGKLYSGNIRFHLHPIGLDYGGGKKIGYFIVDNRMSLEVEKVVPFVAALFLKITELKKVEKEHEYLSHIEQLIKEAEEFSGDCNSQAIYQHLAPFLQKVFSPTIIIIGVKKDNMYEVTAWQEGSEPSILSLSIELSFLLRGCFEYSENSKDFFEKFASLFSMKPEKFIVSAVKFLGKIPELFAIVSCKNRPEEKSLPLLERALAPFLFLRKMKAIEESEKSLADCFNLVAKRLEIQRNVFNKIKSGILVLSDEGTIAFYNSRAEELLKITKVESKEKVLLKSKEPGKTIMTLVSRVKEEGRSVAAPFNVFDKIIDVNVSKMDKGSYLVVCEDSTSLYREMEERKHIFSLITHEIKNPLASVLSASEMIFSERAGKFESPQQKRLSEIIYRNAKQMREILDDVSLFGKSLFGAGGEKDVSIKIMLEKIIEEKKEIAKAKEISIWKEVTDVNMKCNPAMMETLLSNLIGNALKYTSIKGNVGIKVVSLANGILLEVIDDGIGIPDEDIGKIGQPFYRADNVRENISGTGFGLFIVKNIVSRHQGELKILSPITEKDRIFIHSFDYHARGAKFTITFPLIGGKNAE